MISLIIECKIFKNYFDSYCYVVPVPCLSPPEQIGYIKPKEEFEEWFKYIVNFFYNRNNDTVNYKSMLRPDNSFESTTCYSYFIIGTYFEFSFPDEETALYFKMKYVLS